MQNCASTKMTTVVAHLQDDCPISIVNHHPCDTKSTCKFPMDAKLVNNFEVPTW